jgi:hypothetical protein
VSKNNLASQKSKQSDTNLIKYYRETRHILFIIIVRSLYSLLCSYAGVLRLLQSVCFMRVAPLCNSLRNDVASMETYSSCVNCPKETCVSTDLMHLFLARFNAWSQIGRYRKVSWHIYCRFPLTSSNKFLIRELSLLTIYWS